MNPVFFFLWRALPWLDYFVFILIKAFAVAGVFIVLFSHVGSVVSNSMGNFTSQSCSSEGTGVQVSLCMFLKLVGIWYI